MSVSAKATLDEFKPSVLGQYLRHLHESEQRHFVTFLIGAGFSKSAGIPLAGEIVNDLREEAKSHPLLRNLGTCPPGVSEYAFLMAKLGSPRERANRVKKYVDKARDPKSGQLKINWSHLLLAALVEKNCVNRILTTNFDPLIVEALAVTGQPIRTYDLNVTGKYSPGSLDPGSVIYLHGQMHSLFLANSSDETEPLRALYPEVLQEAVQDSILIVLGYSGDCDPVLSALAELPKFPMGLWWSHYSPSGKSCGEEVQKVFEKFGSDFHFSAGDDADTFMRKLVLDGMQLDLPDEVLRPITAIKLALERITPFPNQDVHAPDPVQGALELLRRAEQFIKPAPNEPTNVNTASKTPAPPESALNQLSELSQKVAIEMAALAGNWPKFDELRRAVRANPESTISNAIGGGMIHRASLKLDEGDESAALRLWYEAASFGIPKTMRVWDVNLSGIALLSQAELKRGTPEVERLFAEAAGKFAEAIRIKPDFHAAFNNWGIALSKQAELKANSHEAEHLFAEAAAKYAESIRLKPDMHDTFNNWGIALSTQAALKGNTPEAGHLFAKAASKFAEAIRLKPDFHAAFNNWGIALFKQAQLKGNTPEAERLFAAAAGKFAEALCTKPDFHDPLNNWGGALVKLAQLKGNTPEAERLFAEAAGKFAEALRIKPDLHETLNNWGLSLFEQAKRKGNTPEAECLFDVAAAKYAEALRIKPDFEEVHYNLACLAAQLKRPDQAVAHLERWLSNCPNPKKGRVDADTDFDPIRTHPAFIAFRARLPD